MDIVQFLKLGQKTTEAYDRKDFASARSAIKEQLELISKWKDNWNHDNVIHVSHTFLGLIALEEQKIEKAKEHLLESASIKGSPQLVSFGPNMLLAQKLLELDQKDIVQEYLMLCKNFWLPRFSTENITSWQRSISDGEMPDFGANLTFHLRLHESEAIKKQYGLDN